MKEFVENLKKFSKSIDERKQNPLSFNTKISDENLYLLMKKGWWHTSYFSSDICFQYGLRMRPNTKYTDWSVVQTSLYATSYTFAPNISSFIYFKFMNGLSNEKVFNEIKEQLPLIKDCAAPFLEFTNGTSKFDFFENYLLKTKNSSTDEFKIKCYQDFWLHFDVNNEFKVLQTLIHNMLKDASFFPDEIPSENLGIWETRIKNILAQRAYIINEEVLEFEEVEPVLWQSFKQPHAYDSEGIYFKIWPNSTGKARNNINGVVLLLAADFYNHSPEIIESPLYAALLALENNTNGYFGVQHMEAAAIYDLELNDPVMSWNCLVNAAYWSGVNTSETFLPAWEAAISLAEKYEWKDVHFALKAQYDWYLGYKKKNNLV